MLRLSNVSQRAQPYPLWYEVVWRLISYFLVENRLQPCNGLRVWLLRAFGAQIGRGCVIEPVRVHCPWNLSVGDNCTIQEGVWLHNQGSMTMGSGTVVCNECLITTGSHNLFDMRLITNSVVIESSVLLMHRCIVTLGVRIHSGVVILPATVVRKQLPLPDAGQMAVYAGNPAALFKEQL